MKRILFIHLAIVFSSCTWIFKKAGYIQDPTIETVHSINQYGTTLGIDSANLVFVKDQKALEQCGKIFRTNPEILIFDNRKKYCPYKPDSSTCNAPIDVTLFNICEAGFFSVESTRKANYDSLISLLDDPNKCLAGFDPVDVDYIVFFNFASYFHKVNKEHILSWTNIIKTNKRNCKVKYIFISFDYLDTWGIKKKDLPKFKLHS